MNLQKIKLLVNNLNFGFLSPWIFAFRAILNRSLTASRSVVGRMAMTSLDRFKIFPKIFDPQSDKPKTEVNTTIFLFSGVIAALGQPDRGAFLSLLAYGFGYSGIFYLLKKQGFWVAFLWALGVFGFQLSWLATTHYHGAGIVVVYVAVTILFALQFASLFGFCMTKEFSLKRGLFLAAAWTLIEWSRLFYFCGFPFNTVGLVLTGNLFSIQLASLIGVYGLTFCVIFTSYLMAHARIKSFVICLVIPFFLGWAHIHYWEGKKCGVEPFFDVALVQTGLTAEQKWDFARSSGEAISFEKQWERIFAFLEETKKERFDLIVLPEVALAGDAHEKIVYSEEGFVSHLDMAEKLANLYQSEVVIGLIDESLGETVNAAFHVLPHQGVTNRYEKRVLVPLAEYLPISFLQSFLHSYGITSFFTPGKEAKVFLGKIPFAVSICYEEGFTHVVREGRRKGAKLLLNISNDGWFPLSRLPEEHYNLGKVRAVENGAFVLRACNTGVTSVIDPFGRVLCALKEKDENGKLCNGVQTITIDCYSYPTLFTKFGNAVVLSVCCLLVVVNFLIKRKSCSRVLSSSD